MKTGLTKFGLIVGRDCRIGIHASSNPGLKIGRGSFVAGGAFLTTDIPDRSFVTMKDGKMHTRENRVQPPSAEERMKYVPKK